MVTMSDQIDEMIKLKSKSRSVLVHTLATLISSTKKAREKMNQVKKVEILQIKPVVQTNQLYVKAQAQGISLPKLYQLTLVFSGITYSQTQTTKTPLTADLGHGNKVYLEQPTLSHKVQARCSCHDYYFMWQYYNRQEKALFGKAFPKYIRKTDHLPERNPDHVPGLCKHLIVLVDKLAKAGLLKK